MAVAQNPIRFGDSMDSKEVLDFIFSMAAVLETSTGETIDPDPSRWQITLLPEAIALGLEIISGDPPWPDPTLIEDNTAIRAWLRIDPAFVGNDAFYPGADLPIIVTIWTNSSEPRRRERTFVVTIVER